jgi:methylated-DNA-[protein]-cysteine S-methyltransferase
MESSCFFETSIGIMGLEENGRAITKLYRAKPDSLETKTAALSPLVKETIKQMEEYTKGRRFEFDLPLEPSGTPFQMSVWAALRRIPYGETRSYKEIAIDIGNPKAYRAVGGANNKNPIFILIPCHRVIGADGSLVGFGGGLDLKVRLLYLERDYKRE